tara:strand:- start:36242 stop:36703 length:462 start_codon:yes stop_codon:yes gene_type:complete
MKQSLRSALIILCFYTASAFCAVEAKQDAEQKAMAVLDAFMTSFSASDPIAHTANYHFPHFRLANGEMQVWQTREDAIRDHKLIFPRLQDSGWHHSIWVERKVIGVSDTKVHVATKFRRLREDGSEIVTAESLYVLTLEQGRWGVKLRSSYLR